MLSEFTWTQPVGGKVINWKPLTVGQEIDIEAHHNRPDTAHLRPYVVIQRRITGYDGKPVCTLDDLRSWDVIDLQEFIAEIERKEAERRAAFARKVADASPSPALALEAALADLNASVLHFSSAAQRVLASVKDAGPLAEGPRP